MNLLEINDLNFIYDRYEEFGSEANSNDTKAQGFALEDINLQIPQGSIVTLCGPTGCGKSTLLKLLKQEIAPAGKLTGNIVIDGKPLGELSPVEQASKIALLFQNPDDQIVTDKVWHEIAFGLENLGMSQKDMENKVAEAIAFFRLEHLALQDTAKLSGGQKQILLLASLIVMSPKLLLLDEPISRLDPEATEQFLVTLKRLHEQLGLTIIIAEHKTCSTIPLSDMVIVMDKGKVVSAGSPEETAPVLNKLLPPLESEKALQDMSKKKEATSEAANNANKSDSTLLVSVKDLYFRYSLKSPDVINNLTADFERGCFYSIFGCNAAGKTTFLNLLSGLLKPQEGKIRFADKKPRISYMPQNVELLFSEETVERELAGAGLKKEALPEYTKILDPKRSPFDLSGGEKQLLALALISAKDPDLILLDEPTRGLDNNLALIMAKELNRFTENGKTVIMSTHDIRFAAFASHKCSIMSMGRLTGFKDCDDFFSGNKLYSL